MANGPCGLCERRRRDELMRTIGRVCGGCTACCRTHAVSEIEKPAREWCQHCVIGQGCRIYRDRPNQCKEFSCLWRDGYGAEETRPDKSGVVLIGKDADVGSVLAIFEAREGALDTPFVWNTTHRMLGEKTFVSHTMLSGNIILWLPTHVHLSADAEASWQEEK